MTTRGPPEVVFAIRGPITRADLPGLCERVCAVLAATGTAIACDIRGVEPDAVTIDALARLQLAAKRRGSTVYLTSASRALLELVDLMGLSHVLAQEPRHPQPRGYRLPGRLTMERGR